MSRNKKTYSSNSTTAKPNSDIPPTSFIASFNQMASEPAKPIADKKVASKKTYRKTKFVLIILVILCIAGLGLNGLSQKQKAAVFPVGITAGLPYTVYYPKTKTDGFSYQDGTAKLQTGILFYTLASSTKKIFVTEQAVPSKAINLKSLPKHSPIDMPIGRAVIGTGLGNPSIVIITPTTLIQITSNKGVTKDEITRLAQKLALLNQ